MTRDTSATAIYVAYRTPDLDLDWLPADAEVVVVHNDRMLEPARIQRPGVRHLFPDRNLGFGAAVNLAADEAEGTRLVLCNPDTELRPVHWAALTGGTADEVIGPPQVDVAGHPTSVVNRYPTPSGLLLTGWRVGRLVPRTSPWRRRLAPLGGSWAADNARSLDVVSGRWPLSTHWISGAVLSVDRDRFLSVGGFDARYFLYMEDIDLCARLAARHPGMELVIPEVEPAVHAVGGSAGTPSDAGAVDRHHVESARQYARTRDGFSWKAVDLALVPRQRWVTR